MLIRHLWQLKTVVFRHRCIYVFFLVYAGSGSGQSVLIWTDPEHRESKETVLCPLCGVEISGLEGHWGWTTVWRLAATVWRLAWWFFCWRGSWTAWRSALGGDGVDGHHYWWPCGLSQRIWVIFLQKRRKILGSKNLRLSALNFLRYYILYIYVLFYCHPHFMLSNLSTTQ